jgi:hypothetical protein
MRGVYPSVYIKDKNYSIHRLVATYFVSNPNPEEFNVINHIDNDYMNFKYDNLEWCTTKMNVHHSLKQGRHTSQTSKKSIECRNKPDVPSKIQRKPKSGVMGIQIRLQSSGQIKYLVYFSKIKKYLGSFSILEEAKEAYKKAYFKKYGVDPYEGA